MLQIYNVLWLHDVHAVGDATCIRKLEAAFVVDCM